MINPDGDFSYIIKNGNLSKGRRLSEGDDWSLDQTQYFRYGEWYFEDTNSIVGEYTDSDT